MHYYLPSPPFPKHYQSTINSKAKEKIEPGRTKGAWLHNVCLIIVYFNITGAKKKLEGMVVCYCD